MRKNGFTIIGNDDCPICPVWIVDEQIGRKMELRLLEIGVYTILIGFPVCPVGEARMRCILTSNHTKEDIEEACKKFKQVADEYNFFEHVEQYKKDLAWKLKRYAIVEYLKSWFIPKKDFF